MTVPTCIEVGRITVCMAITHGEPFAVLHDVMVRLRLAGVLKAGGFQTPE